VKHIPDFGFAFAIVVREGLVERGADQHKFFSLLDTTHQRTVALPFLAFVHVLFAISALGLIAVYKLARLIVENPMLGKYEP
jgi:hypothetical protein